MIPRELAAQSTVARGQKKGQETTLLAHVDVMRAFTAARFYTLLCRRTERAAARD